MEQVSVLCDGRGTVEDGRCATEGKRRQSEKRKSPPLHKPQGWATRSCLRALRLRHPQNKGRRRWTDAAAIPPLRGPTRQKAARKRKSGRYGRDDKVGLPQKSRLSGPFGYAQGRRDDITWEERTYPCIRRKG